MLYFVKNEVFLNDNNDDNDKEKNQKINIKHKKIIITGKRKLLVFIKNNN
jgi:hypothetical protein